MIVTVKRENANSGAIPSKVFTNGAFFGYGLENEAYKIPAGRYDCSGLTSQKFGSKKLYINVPGRSGIMFHGANTAEDLKGCIGIARERNGATISGDLSGELYEKVNAAATAGEGVAVVVSDPFPWLWVIAASALGFVFYRAAL